MEALAVLGLGGSRRRPQKPEPPNMKDNEHKKGKPSDLGEAWQELFRSTMREWYREKHRRPSGEEVAMANMIPISECPYCGSHRVRLDGKSKKTGLKIRECRDCGRKFNPLTGTIFDSRKIPISEWFEFLGHLFQLHSVQSSARSNMNAKSTGRYWLSKVFLVLRGCQEGTVLGGTVYIDETYFPLAPSARSGAKGSRKRGLSAEQLCVATVAAGKSCVLAVCGTGSPSAAECLKAYLPHIAKGSLIVHDGAKCHAGLAEAACCSEKIIPADKARNLPDSKNPMDPVNEVHRFLKLFMSRHGSYSRDRLQEWLNLFWFYWNVGGDPFDKAFELTKLAMTKRVVLRYRDWAKSEKRD